MILILPPQKVVVSLKPLPSDTTLGGGQSYQGISRHHEGEARNRKGLRLRKETGTTKETVCQAPPGE